MLTSFENLLALEDLFAAGLGFCLAGPYLLGRGLLATPGEIARRSRPVEAYEAPAIVAAARSRVATLTGLVALGVGFGLQALGFVLVVAGVEAGERGAEGALIAAVCAAAGAGTTFALWNGVRGGATRALLVEVARHDPRTGERRPLPAGDRLRAFGQELGYLLTPEEATPGGAAIYARRVFGVAEIDIAHDHLPDSPG